MYFKHTTRINLLLGASLLLISSNAQSAFIDNGLTTTDTSSGLIWLDLTETENFSYNEVEAELGIGGLFEGYRRATTFELDALFSNFGLTTGPVNATHEEFINLFGTTTMQGDYAETFGYAETNASLAQVYGLDFFFNNGIPSYIALTGGLQQNIGINFEGFGSYLVQPVPVPAAVWLFGSGLFALATFTRRRLSKQHR